jgi:hypothetical protein
MIDYFALVFSLLLLSESNVDFSYIFDSPHFNYALSSFPYVQLLARKVVSAIVYLGRIRCSKVLDWLLCNDVLPLLLR